MIQRVLRGVERGSNPRCSPGEGEVGGSLGEID